MTLKKHTNRDINLHEEDNPLNLQKAIEKGGPGSGRKYRGGSKKKDTYTSYGADTPEEVGFAIALQLGMDKDEVRGKIKDVRYIAHDTSEITWENGIIGEYKFGGVGFYSKDLEAIKNDMNKVKSIKEKFDYEAASIQQMGEPDEKVFDESKGKLLNQMGERKQKESDNHYDGKKELLDLLRLHEVDQERFDYVFNNAKKVVSTAGGEINVTWSDGKEKMYKAGGAGFNDYVLEELLQDAYDAEYDEEPTKANVKETIGHLQSKVDSFKSGVKNLKANLDSNIERYKNELSMITDSYDPEISDRQRNKLDWDKAKTEAKLDGFLRAKELLNDGLKHLL